MQAEMPDDNVDRAAGFLLARLDEWSADYLTDEGARDWMGHVEPAMEKLRDALYRTPKRSR